MLPNDSPACALCPQALSLPLDFDEYRRYWRPFKAAIAEVAPSIEDRSIDEFYIDLTELPGCHSFAMAASRSGPDAWRPSSSRRVHCGLIWSKWGAFAHCQFRRDPKSIYASD